MKTRDPDLWTGRRPWPFSEFYPFYQEFNDLMDRPVDDWDHRVRKIGITEDDGSVEKFVLNTKSPYSQALFLLSRHYPNDDAAYMAHASRLDRIQTFLHRHQGRLKRDGLVRVEGDHRLTANWLLQALCEVPFTAGRGMNRRFKYADVLDRCVEIYQKQHGEPPA